MSKSSEKKQSLFQWQRIQRFNLNVWAVLSGTLLARTSYFMAWPFIGGIILQWFSATWLFALCFFSCFIMYALYSYVENKVNETTNNQLQKVDC